jgi:hypothetical protein
MTAEYRTVDEMRHLSHHRVAKPCSCSTELHTDHRSALVCADPKGELVVGWQQQHDYLWARYADVKPWERVPQVMARQTSWLPQLCRVCKPGHWFTWVETYLNKVSTIAHSRCARMTGGSARSPDQELLPRRSCGAAASRTESTRIATRSGARIAKVSVPCTGHATGVLDQLRSV